MSSVSWVLSLTCMASFLLLFRVKSGLLSGELVISGDMWPRFLYQNFEYNPEEPWEGLFRSGLLVRVSGFLSFPVDNSAYRLPRDLSMSSHRPAP